MRSIFAVAGLACVCAAIAGCSRCAPEPTRPPHAATDADKPATLAALPGEGAAPGAGGAAGASFTVASDFVFASRGAAVAWTEEGGGAFRVVHDGVAGRAYAAIGDVVLSPDGARLAYPAQARDGAWHMVVDEREGPGFAQVEAAVFSSDGAHVAYQARTAERWSLVVDGTSGEGVSGPYAAYEFAAGPRIVWVEGVDDQGLGTLMVSDLERRRLTRVDDRVGALVLNAAGTRAAAVSASTAGECVLTFELDRPERVARGPIADSVRGLAFSQDGASLAYVAERAGGRTVVLDGREAPLPPGEIVGTGHDGAPVVRPDRSGVGALLASDGTVTFQEFLVTGTAPEGRYDEADGLVYASAGRAHAYAARRGDRWFVVVNGKEGPAFDRVVSPEFSADGKRLVYRAREGGKRFVVIADLSASTLRRLPAYEQVFPVRFTADGKSVAYGVKDGTKLAWKVEAL